MAIPNILSMNIEEKRNFLKSFDTVFFDCDGVLWNPYPIPGVKEALQMLQEMGKNIYFLSNNSERNQQKYDSKFACIGIKLTEGQLVHPEIVILDYLKCHGFSDKKIFTSVSKRTNEVLREAGFDIVTAPAQCPDNADDALSLVMSNKEDIGAVIFDTDLCVNYATFLKAIWILKNPEVVYIVGATDKDLPFMKNFILPGPGYFHEIITKVSGRTPIVLGKPSKYLETFVKRNFNICDNKRVLLVGDTMEQDMAFGSMCGFQKLLVMTGGSSQKDIQTTSNRDFLPNYWIESMDDMVSVINEINECC